MQAINTMILSAQARRQVAEQAIQKQREERRQDTMAQFRADLNDLFGPLVDMLDMAIQTGEYDDSAYAMFGYESRLYRLSRGRYNWYLVRRDTRLEDDDRELPSSEVYASYHNGLQSNQDALLLALAGLADQPEAPPPPARKDEPIPPVELIGKFLSDVSAEVARATSKYPPFNSAHEGYAVLLEEVDELWTEVKRKQIERDPHALITESLHVAAMATRFAVEIAISNPHK